LAGVLALAAWLVLSAQAGAADTVMAASTNKLAAEVRGLGWIAYGARSAQNDWDLFLCRPDGSNARPLTRTPAWSEFSPQFSRDGRKLLYRRMSPTEQLDNNRHGEQGSLVLANADGTEAVVLGEPGELTWASFSPDGSQIASLSIKGVTIFDLEQKKVLRTLPRKGFFQQMTWSPDGKWLVGVANSFGASWSIARMDATTSEASAVNKVDCCTPDWFPNSQDVIFSWRPPGQKANKGYGWTELWRASADGSSRQLVYAEEGRHVYGGQVSPDGRYVVFTGNVEEDGDPGRAGAPMGLMRLSDAPIIVGASPEARGRHPGAKDRPILILPAGWEPCWTAADIPALPGSANVPRQEGSTEALKAGLRDQGQIVFSARTEAGDWDLFVMRPDGSDRRPLTRTPDLNEAGARFSPDGQRLLYYQMPRSEPVDNNTYGTFELVVAAADGRDPVVYGSRYPWASWGPDGRQVACLTTKGIQVFDAATRKTIRELPRKGIVSQLVWSPDGRWFTGTANGLGPYWNIGCLDAATGNIQAVSETDRYNCTSDWAPDSRQIVYARGIIPQQPGRAELWVANRDGSGRRCLYAEPGTHIYGAGTSPDGRSLLFTRSVDDLGKVGEIRMAVLPWPSATGTALSKYLDLGPGWEPNWTSKPWMKESNLGALSNH
jgi:Tol biopolymer transport system component